jgi:hypothetical protein
LIRTERSVRRNEARDTQERERDALAALTAMDQDEGTVTERSGIGRSEQVMSPTIPDMPNNQERYKGGVLNRTSQDETPLGADDNSIRTPSTPGGA